MKRKLLSFQNSEGLSPQVKPEASEECVCGGEWAVGVVSKSRGYFDSWDVAKIVFFSCPIHPASSDDNILHNTARGQTPKLLLVEGSTH